MLEVLVSGTPQLRKAETEAILLDGNGVTAVVAYTLSRIFSTPLIYRLGGNPYTVERGKLEDAKTKGKVQYWRFYVFYVLSTFILEHSDGIIVVSDDLKSELVELGNISEEIVRVVHVPIYEDFGSDGAVNESDGLNILTVTNLDFERKFEGVERSLEIVQPLLRSHDDVSYTIAGGGDYLSRAEDAIESQCSEAVRSNIRLPGYVDEIEELYARADLFLYISRIDGYPNVVIEAMYSGLPVVTNDAFGMKEQVSHGESGYLVDPDDIEESRKLLEELITDEEKRAQFGRRGREKVRKENSPVAVGNSLAAAVTELSS